MAALARGGPSPPPSPARGEGAGLPSMAALARGGPSPPALMGLDQQPGAIWETGPGPASG